MWIKAGEFLRLHWPSVKAYTLLAGLSLFLVSSCREEEPTKGAISGRVTLVGTQIPIEGIPISLTGSRTARATSDGEGRFSFTELPTGRYTIAASPPSFYQELAPLSLEVRSNVITPADFSLIPKGSISGKITEEGKTIGIAAADVRLTGGPFKLGETKKTDVSGDYNFSALADGSYEIEVTHPDYIVASKEYVVKDGGQVEADISLGKSGPVLEVFPTSLDFGLNENQLSIDIRNEGRDGLEWNIAEARSELTVFPVDGTLSPGESEAVRIELDRSSLSPNSYSYTIEVQSNAGTKDVGISFEVTRIDSCEEEGPIADFEIINAGCQAPCEVRFENRSLNATSFFWEFDDGETSSKQSPAHYFQQQGDYGVKLVAINNECRDTVTRNVSIDWLTYNKKLIDESGNNSGISILESSQGGYIILASVSGRMKVLGVSIFGVTEWTRDFGLAQPISMRKTIDGQYIIGACIQKENSSLFGDILLVKISEEGVLSWSRKLGDEENIELAQFMIEDTEGNYLVGGIFAKDAPSTVIHDLFFKKTNSGGLITWDSTFLSEEYEKAYDAIQTTDGGYLVVGSINIEGSPLLHPLILKLSSKGSLEWKYTIEGNDFSYAKTIKKNNDGEFLVFGYASSNDSNNNSDIEILNVSAEGVVRWRKTIGSGDNESLSSVIQTSDGHYFGTGSVHGNLFRVPYLIKISNEGEIIWDNVKTEFNGLSGLAGIETEDGGFAFVASGNGQVFIIKTDDEGNVQ